MTATSTAPADLDQLLDAAGDLIGAASRAGTLMADLVRRVMSDDPDTARAALAAMKELVTAQTRLLAAADQVDQ